MAIDSASGDIAIAHENNGRTGRYVARFGGGDEAEMTYRQAGEHTIAIDHTFVPPARRGQGIAERLVLRAIEDARRENFTIIPICPYVAAQFRRHPEWAALKAS